MSVDNRFDTETVAAIVLGTILLVVSYFLLGVNAAVSDMCLIQIYAIVVVILSAVYGAVAGFVIPFAAFIIIYTANPGSTSVTGILFLVLFGVATGHYGRRFMLREGGFGGMRIVDYVVVETVVAILVWVGINPLFEFYVRTADLRATMLRGISYSGVSIATKLIIGLPLLLLLNRLYKKRRDVAAARDEL